MYNYILKSFSQCQSLTAIDLTECLNFLCAFISVLSFSNFMLSKCTLFNFMFVKCFYLQLTSYSEPVGKAIRHLFTFWHVCRESSEIIWNALHVWQFWHLIKVFPFLVQTWEQLLNKHFYSRYWNCRRGNDQIDPT